MFCKVTAFGQVQQIKPTPKGAALVFVKTATTPETRVNGQPLALFFTSVNVIRFPAKLYARFKDEIKVGVFCAIDGHLQGMRRPLDGGDQYYNEAVANTFRPVDKELLVAYLQGEVELEDFANTDDSDQKANDAVNVEDVDQKTKLNK